MKRAIALLVLTIALVLVPVLPASSGPPSEQVGYPGGHCEVHATFGFDSAPVHVLAPHAFCSRFGP